MLTAFLIAWPLLTGLLLLLLNGKNAKWAALISTLVQFGVTLFALYGFEQNETVQYALNEPWIQDFGIRFHVGMDGISMLMVLLTNLLLPLIILSSNRINYSRAHIFYALALVMQSAMVGVFVAQDAFLYYIFWELALIPIYFIVLIWGGNDKVRITFKFFIYTLFGSLLMLVGFIFLYFQTPAPHSFDINAFINLGLERNIQSWIFWALFIAFAIKMPIFPFHTWQPDTYTVAPTQGTMLLSGIMLKMGIYSVIRWLLPIVPQGVEDWSTFVMILSIIGIVYASWIAITQRDMKRLFAYSSIAHVGLISAGIFSLSQHGLQGSMVQMLSHGINVIGLFFVAQIIYTRTKTNDLPSLGGIVHQAPRFATLFLIILFGTVALPLTNGFVGEFLLLSGVYQYNTWMALFAGTTIIFGAIYMLRTYQQSMLGELKPENGKFEDLHTCEGIVLATIAGLVIFIGIYPKPFLALTEPAVKNLLETIYHQNITLR
ncbi:MAG: NADH-quinone oxidoreductase subunit M [Sphingobacteriales bacterium]|nr:MAG: NADH-quinone oxidoreductase subunit M [Sphingobacteriales bacterium]